MSELYIGVMSGTSLDGIDIALCEIDSLGCRLISAKEYSFDKELKAKVLSMIENQVTLKEVGELDIRLGKLFSDKINTFIKEKNINSSTITAIGLHGQTLWHEPNSEYPFSMQLGNANIVTTRTNISVVSDFRGKDVALGGQGAPFAPAFHQFVFGTLEKKVAVLNIGGIANISILGDKTIGYDIGSGNVLVDMWISQCKNLPYDKDGAFAKSGTPNQNLLDAMLDDVYFKKLPPKSTGREYFNETWLANYLPIFQSIKEEDIQATLLELTVISIANEVKKSQIQLLIVCGGGAKNTLLMQRLQEELQDVEVTCSDNYGVSGDFMEAMAFAWLAYKRMHSESVKLSSITGAKEDSILGAYYI